MTHRLSSSLRNLCLFLLLLVGTFLPTACQKNTDTESPGPKQRGQLVHGFEEITNCIPTGNDQYAWLLTSTYSKHLAPDSVYLANQYGNILPEKKSLSGGQKIRQIWTIPNVPHQLWAATDSSLFFIDVPYNNAPLIEQARFTGPFDAAPNETVSRLEPIPNSRSAWLITDRNAGESIQHSLYFVDADRSPPVTTVALPAGIEVRAIFASPNGKSAWLVWQSPGFTPEGGAMFLENKESVVSAREPISWGEYRLEEAVPIKDGTLAWKINRDFLLTKSFSGSNPALISNDGGIWSVSDRLFDRAHIFYAVAENTGGDLPMWVRVEKKPGVYLIEATPEGPRRGKDFIRDVLPESIVPSRDGKSAWVLDEGGSSAFRLGIDGSVQKFALTFEPKMRAISIRPSPNGQKAWGFAGQPPKPGESDAQQNFTLFYLDSKSEQFKKIPLPVKSLIVLTAPDNQHAISVDPSVPLHARRDIRELKYYLLSDDAVENGGESLLTVQETSLTAGAESLSPLWVRDGKRGCWVVRWEKGAITSASISLNKAADLTYEEARNDKQDSVSTLTLGTRIESAEVQLALEGQRQANAYDGTVQLFFLDAESGQEVYKTGAVKLRESNLLQLNWSPLRNHPYVIGLTFQDQYGTKSVIQWPNVEFKVPLWELPWVRTVVAFLAVCLVSALAFAWKPKNFRFHRWLPFGVIISANALTFLDVIGVWIDATLFSVLVVASAIVVLLAGLFSSRVFRTLAQVEPFHLIAPHLLSPRMRGKVFAPYAEQLREQIRLARGRANSEVYTAIPAKIDNNPTVLNPAEEIVNSVVAPPGQKTHILIEAPGGTGKSALLREVIDQSLTRFLDNVRLPLPVLCEGTGSLEQMAQTALGKYALAPKILASQLDEGHFFLVIDGPQESKIPLAEIRDWVRSERAENTVLLIASRPRDDVREAVQLADHSSLVTPERLTDDNLGAFEDAYIRETTSAPPPQKLTDRVKEVCRGADGSYLPILVRLALLVASDEPHSIAQLYEKTFRLLLRAQSSEASVLDEAGKLCVDTYWENGQRSIVYDRASDQRFQLMKRLREAGVLVRSDGVLDSKDDPREVRFFHDSMQSYLTARGLLNGDSDWKKALSKAAGHPQFRESVQSESLEQGSELFRMCLQVFGPENELQQALRSDLLLWASVHDKDLTRNDVERSLPEPVLAELNQPAAAELGAGAVLRLAVEQLTNSSDSKTTQQLSGLYARIAEKVWPLVEKQNSAGEAPVPKEPTPAQPTAKP